MKKIEKVCNGIIKIQSKLSNSEYKSKILLACEKSKELNYSMSPYELMFIENWSHIL
jgi:hypothetical protein